MKHVFHYLNTTKGKHLVLVAKYFDYRHYDTGWMRDNNLPAQDQISIPSIDIVENDGTFVFDTEYEAMEKICLKYGKQSTAIRQLLIDSLLVLKGENESMVDHINLTYKIEKFLKDK